MLQPLIVLFATRAKYRECWRSSMLVSHIVVLVQSFGIVDLTLSP